jgi:diadenosine tetraphosphate (Ap4A) HIT family hydrolase
LKPASFFVLYRLSTPLLKSLCMFSSGFVLHPQLENDSVWVGNLLLSQVRLHTNASWPWVILVPRTRELTQELVDLTEAESLQVYKEIRSVSTALRVLFQPDKLNTGILGNIVSQLHIHLVARYKDDLAWPGPVWGHSARKSYTREALNARVEALAAILKVHNADFQT